MHSNERGQATVEFALILLPLLAIVSGIIYFGIGLNFWLDMNRVANQGARWAAVNNWPPVCARGSASCNASPPTCSAITAGGSNAKLQDVLRCEARNNPAVKICYPGKDPVGVGSAGPLRGDPVKVTLTAPYEFFFIDKVGITLSATATLRMEQTPTLITGAVGPTC